MVSWSHHRLALGQDICNHATSSANLWTLVTTDLETARMTGTSPGSKMQYEIPVNVVPTSNASTSFLVGPSYGCRVSIAVTWVVYSDPGRRLYAKGHTLHFEVSISGLGVQRVGSVYPFCVT